MSTLDVDTQRIVDRLAGLAEQMQGLADQAEELKAELRGRLAFGTKYVDEAGVERVQLQPNRRFSAKKAAEVLPLHLIQSCLTQSIDSKKVKAQVAPDTYIRCCDEYASKVVLL